MIVDYNNKELIVSFAYDPDMVTVIKTIPGRKWDPERMKWIIPISQIKTLIERFNLTSQHFTPEAQCLLSSTNQKNESFELATKIPLYQFQKTSCQKALRKTSYALFLEMGLGKTAIAVAIADHRKQHNIINKVVIICPLSVVWNWKEEIEKFSTLSPEIYIAHGNNRKKIIHQFEKSKEYSFLIMNYDIITDDLPVGYTTLLIFDESTRIKTPEAKRTKVSMALSIQTQYKLILSGNPITNSLLDVWSQFYILDNGEAFGDSYWKFRREYFYADYMGWHWFPKDNTVKYIQSAVENQSIIIKKKDAIDLPEKIYEKRVIEFTPEQKKIYDDIAEKLYHEFEQDEVTANLAVTKIMKLMQITSGFVLSDTSQIHDIGSPKIDIVKELIEDMDINNNKIVIWAHFVFTIKRLEKELNEHNPLTLYGETKNYQEVIDKFNKEDKHRILIANPLSGGLGINLTISNNVIYYENSYSVESRVQSEDRTHRIGTKNNVLYVDCIIANSIDETIKKAISSKINIAKMVVKSNFKDIAYGQIRL